MNIERSILALGVLFVAAACGRGKEGAQLDSTAFALNPPADSQAVVSPQELPPAPAPAPAPAPPAAQPRPRPNPPPPPAPQPPAPQPPPPPTASPKASVGTEFATNSSVEISTRKNKAGETFTARVAAPVNDGSREVIPAGALVTYRIVVSKEAENKNSEGQLAIQPVSIAFGDKTYPLTAEVSDLQYELRGRGVTAGDAGKVAAGAAVGAIVGQILTKKTTGTVVGGAVGAAAGTAIAIKSADKDVVIPSGARIVLKLTEAFTRS